MFFIFSCPLMAASAMCSRCFACTCSRSMSLSACSGDRLSRARPKGIDATSLFHMSGSDFIAFELCPVLRGGGVGVGGCGWVGRGAAGGAGAGEAHDMRRSRVDRRTGRVVHGPLDPEDGRRARDPHRHDVGAVSPKRGHSGCDGKPTPNSIVTRIVTRCRGGAPKVAALRWDASYESALRMCGQPKPAKPSQDHHHIRDGTKQEPHGARRTACKRKDVTGQQRAKAPYPRQRCRRS